MWFLEKSTDTLEMSLQRLSPSDSTVYLDWLTGCQIKAALTNFVKMDQYFYFIKSELIILTMHQIIVCKVGLKTL